MLKLLNRSADKKATVFHLMQIPTKQQLSVRESTIYDLERIVDYFLNAEKDFLIGMGVDIAKLPAKTEWMNMLLSNDQQSSENKKFYYITWLINDEAIGHSNINRIIFGQEAYMHLHVWQSQNRNQGIGLKLLQMTLPYYFDVFKLKYLYCEPSASNPAPNKALEKLGFDFIKSYDTTPGWINFHQTVNRWCLTKEKFESLSKNH
jgi:RimJ/RimL family protein N-acetyltransferase